MKKSKSKIRSVQGQVVAQKKRKLKKIKNSELYTDSEGNLVAIGSVVVNPPKEVEPFCKTCDL